MHGASHKNSCAGGCLVHGAARRSKVGDVCVCVCVSDIVDMCEMSPYEAVV